MKLIVHAFASLFLLLSLNVEAKTVRALFLGNSYTDYNNLPELVRQMALSTGDTLIFSKNTPGGYRFQQHSTNPTSLALIAEGNWDFVVLQEQSQLPSFPEGQVASQVYPYARALDSLVKHHNPCATTMFYMTWGRKYGDTDNCPYMDYLCTYEGMDSALQLRYTIMAENNEAAISPVAKVWRSIRTAYPSLELYTSDNSHPSNNGSYAAAASFYTMMFEKDPELITYNFSVTPANATIIRSIAKAIVFDSIDHWNRFVPSASLEPLFTHTFVTSSNVQFTNTTEGAVSYLWAFGDGSTSTEASPLHSYSAGGTYTVTLTVFDACGKSATTTLDITISTTGNDQNMTWSQHFNLYPNPTSDKVIISWSQIDVAAIKLINTLGVVIAQIQPSKVMAEFNVSSYPAGTYFIMCESTEGAVYVSKFIKQ